MSDTGVSEPPLAFHSFQAPWRKWIGTYLDAQHTEDFVNASPLAASFKDQLAWHGPGLSVWVRQAAAARVLNL